MMTVAGRVLTVRYAAREKGLLTQELATRLGLGSNAVTLALEEMHPRD